MERTILTPELLRTIETESVGCLEDLLVFRRLVDGSIVFQAPLQVTCFDGIYRLGLDRETLVILQHGTPNDVRFYNMHALARASQPLQPFKVFSLHRGCPRRMALVDPDTERRYVVTSGGTSLGLWDVEEGQLLGKQVYERNSFHSLTVDLVKKRAWGCGPGREIAVVDAKTMQRVESINHPHQCMVDGLASSEEFRLVVSMSDDGTLCVWSASEMNQLEHVSVAPGNSLGCGVFLDDRRLFVTNDSKDIFLFDPRRFDVVMETIPTPLNGSYGAHIWDCVRAARNDVVFVGNTKLCYDVVGRKQKWLKESSRDIYGGVRMVPEENSEIAQMLQEENERIQYALISLPSLFDVKFRLLVEDGGLLELVAPKSLFA